MELESNYEELRTESAKYQGSVQALTIIRDKLIEENKSLDNAKRRAEEGQRSAEEGRRRSEEGRKALSRQLSSLQSVVSGLRSQVNELRGEKEEAMVSGLCDYMLLMSNSHYLLPPPTLSPPLSLSNPLSSAGWVVSDVRITRSICRERSGVDRGAGGHGGTEYSSCL